MSLLKKYSRLYVKNINSKKVIKRILGRKTMKSMRNCLIEN